MTLKANSQMDEHELRNGQGYLPSLSYFATAGRTNLIQRTTILCVQCTHDGMRCNARCASRVEDVARFRRRCGEDATSHRCCTQPRSSARHSNWSPSRRCRGTNTMYTRGMQSQCIESRNESNDCWGRWLCRLSPSVAVDTPPHAP